MEQKYLLTIIVIMLFFLLVLMGMLGLALYFIFNINKQRVSDTTPPNGSKMEELITAVKDVRNEIDRTHEAQKGNFCKLHPGVKAAGICGICEEMFCEDCLMELDRISFCPEHFRLVNATEWALIEEVKTDPNNPEQGVYVYQFKRDQWKDKMTPMYVVTHYQINVDSDYIESQVSLFGPRSDQFYLASELKKFKDTKKPA